MRNLKKGGTFFKRMSFIIGSFVLLVILFCCSAFFSASETSLFSLSPLKVRHLEKHGGATGRIIARLLAGKLEIPPPPVSLAAPRKDGSELPVGAQSA